MATKPATRAEGLSPATDRRRSLRQRIRGLFALRLGPDNGGIVMDAGSGGLAVQAVNALPEGERVLLHLALPGGGEIEAACEVISAAPDGRMGLHLLEISAEDRRVFDRWLAELRQESEVEEEPARRSDPAFTIATQAGEGLDGLRALIDLERPDTPQALDLVCQAARERMHASGATIALAEDGAILCRASSGNAPAVGARAPNSGLSAECIRSRRGVICMDAESDPRINAAACRALGVRSVLAVPIAAGEDVAGLLEVFCDRPMAFNGQDQIVLMEYAELAAAIVALGNSAELSGGQGAPAVVKPAPEPAASLPAAPVAPSESKPPVVPKRPTSGEAPASAPPSIQPPQPRSTASAGSSRPAEELPAATVLPPPSPTSPAATGAQHPSPAPAPGSEKPAAGARPALRLREQPGVPATYSPQVRLARGTHPSPAASSRKLLAVAAVIFVFFAGWLALQTIRWSAGLPATSTALPSTQDALAEAAPSSATAEPEPGSGPVEAAAARPASATSEPRQQVSRDTRPTPPPQRSAAPPSAQRPVAAAPAVAAASQEPIRIAAGESLTETPPPPAAVLPGSERSSLPLAVGLPPAPVLVAQPAGSRVEPGTLVHRVQPVYPQVLRATGIFGEVLLKAQIRKDGQVGDVTVISGHPVLAQAAVDAVRRWRYTPFRLNQQPVEAEVDVRVVFSRSQ